MSRLSRVSIVVEWSNALLAESARPRRMVETVFEQARELRIGPEGSPALATAGPIEFLVCFDSDKVDAATISAVAPRATPGRHGPLDVSFHPFRGAEYYELKNRGAQAAAGDLLVFVDSDIIPQPGWLSSLMASFDDPNVAVAGGITFIEPTGLHGKSIALNWVFELPPDSRTLRQDVRFWANNVCFRREIFLNNPFPATHGASRGACRHLANQLLAQRIPIHINGNARVAHPAPAGASGFFRRAMAQGRDRVLWHRRFGTWWLQSIPAGLLRYARHLARVVLTTVRHWREVDLKPWEVPAVLVISAVYYTVFFFGELTTHVLPGVMRRSFRV